MVNSRARFEKINHSGLFLFRRERGLLVVDAKLLQRVVEIDFAIGYGNADQRAQQALAAGVQIRLARYIAPCGNHYAMLHDHDRCGADLLGIFVNHFQVLRLPPGLFRRG